MSKLIKVILFVALAIFVVGFIWALVSVVKRNRTADTLTNTPSEQIENPQNNESGKTPQIREPETNIPTSGADLYITSPRPLSHPTTSPTPESTATDEYEDNSVEAGSARAWIDENGVAHVEVN